MAAKKSAGGKSADKTSTNNTSPNKATASKAPAKKPAAKSSSSKSPAKTAESVAAEAPWLSDAKWLASQREALLAERQRYTANAERLAAEAASLMADREPGDVQFDEESGEGDTVAVERDLDLALSAQARDAVEEIDAALARLDDGSYGFCVVSGDPIQKERLEAIPQASLSVVAKAARL